jgi:hypothetical protein
MKASLETKFGQVIEENKLFTTKRFILFSGSKYYPAGGWEDKIIQSNELEKIVEKITDIALGDEDRWFQVVDLAINEPILDSETLKDNCEDFREYVKNKMMTYLLRGIETQNFLLKNEQ